MRVAGTAVADQLIAYLRYRAAGRSTTRLFVSEYPREVLEVACRSLVERAESVESEEIDLGSGLRLAVALIQSPAAVSAGSLAVERGYQVGVSPDFPVALRNRRGNVLVACPPELIDLCHESIKTNSFQHFSANRRFGSDLQLFRQIGKRLTDDEDLSRRYADVLRAAYRRERDRRGAAGESSVFERVERVVETARETGGAPDWRFLGLLPQLQLDNSFAGDAASSSRRISSAVGRNLEFQSSLVEGISREQHRYLRRFADTEGYEKLRDFLGARSFRLDLDDPRWRTEWPRNLTIEGLSGTARAAAALRITSFRLRGTGEVLGLPIAADSLEATWRLPRHVEGLPGRITIDGDLDYELEDLASGRARLEELDLAPGRHEVEIVADDLALAGQTRASFFVPSDEPTLLATVGNQLPGAGVYRVPENESFRLRWAAVPPAQVHEFVVRVVVGAESDTIDDTLPGGRDSRDFFGGIDAPIDVRIEGRDAAETPLLDTELRIEAVREEQVVAVPTVARALLWFAEHLAPDSERPRSPVSVEATGEGYEVRMEHGDDLQIVSFRPRSTDLLDRSEQSFLDRPAEPQPLSVVRMRRGRGYRWLPAQTGADRLGEAVPEEVWSHFVERRRRALGRLKELGGSGLARLVDLEEEIEEYAAAYRRLLSSLFRGEERIDRARALVCLFDCLLVSREPSLVEESDEPPTAELPEDVVAVLVSPTHPLRLAWLLQLERSLGELLVGVEPWSHETLLAVESRAFPACVVDWRLDHFHAASTAAGGRWTVLLREGITEIDRLMPAALGRELDADAPREASSTSPDQLSAGVVQFHELHPQRDALRLGYANPGTGETILESLERLVPGRGSGQRRGALAKETAARCAYDVNLLDLYTGRPNWETGSAFGEYATGDDPDPDLLERVTFGVERARLDEFAVADVRNSHLLFGSNVFELRGESIPIPANAVVPTFGGLVSPSRRVFELADPPRVVSYTLVPKPADWEAREGGSLAWAIHGILFGLQCAAAATVDRPTASQTHGRALVAQVDAGMSRVIDRMHDLSEWVYLMDSHVDVEYFDQPSLHERYVIDYVPRILAGNGPGRRHNYVISTKKDAVLRAAINRFLHAAYAHEDVPDDAAQRLSEALNRLSGRLLLQLIRNPSLAKGAVGMGLLQLLMQSLGLLEPTPPNSMRALLPIDDYAAEWNHELFSLQGEAARDRADILDVSVGRDEDGEIRLTLQVIEIKNVRRSYSTADLREGPFRQIANTARLLEAIYGFGAAGTRGDRAAKDMELARLLDFHLRRTAMQQVGSDPARLRDAAALRSETLAAIAAGQYQIGWRETSDGRAAFGFVAHFNAGQTYASASREPEAVESEDGVGLYVGFGRSDIARLLAGELPEGIREKSHWFTGAITMPPVAAEPGQAPAPPAAAAEPPREPARPPTEFARAREAFAGFVGNEEAVRRLLPWIAVAMRQSPPRLRENIAFTGPPSTGKTELARRIARALGLPFLTTSGSALRSLDDLLQKMEREVQDAGGTLTDIGREGGLPVRRFPPLVVFVDEAHEIRRPVQEELLTLLEPRDRRAAGSRFIADATDVTFVLATTEWGQLIGTLQSRLQRVPLEPYSQEEVTEMVRNRHDAWSEEICRRLAIAGRRVPRVALQKAQEFANALEAYGDVDPDSLLDQYFALWRIDELGVDENDRRYLRVLDESAGPVGLDRIAARLRMGEREISQTIEPYLDALGFIEIGVRGRTLAERGKQYLRSRQERAA